MVWSVIQNFRQAMKYRGGAWGVLEHMYTNSDYPFKFGTFMGYDAAGNRYYENRVDYPFGQHRWVEPGDIHNFDSSSIAPEWHCWMVSMNDTVPTSASEEEYVQARLKNLMPIENTDTEMIEHNLGHQNKVFNWHNMHNQSQMRSRGYGIGNPIVGLPPGAPDAYYTQPGSPYNEASRRKLEFIGDLDEAKGGGRPYKSQKWADRLTTTAEKEAATSAKQAQDSTYMNQIQKEIANNKAGMRSRGAGTVVRK